jgi:hypothetical protein
VQDTELWVLKLGKFQSHQDGKLILISLLLWIEYPKVTTPRSNGFCHYQKGRRPGNQHHLSCNHN